MSSDAADVVIVGGGITGLAAAAAIHDRQPSAAVVVLEANETLGGKIRTVDFDGICLETGADSFLDRDPAGVALCASVGLGDRLIAPAVFGGMVATRDGLKRLPAGFAFGLPTSIRALAGASDLSLKGRARALKDAAVRSRLTDDVSVGAFVRDRFGTEILEKTVDPLLAGTRAGDVDDMSLAAAMPQIFAAAHSSGSVMRGLKRTPSVNGGTPPFVTVRGGLGGLIDALRRRLETADVRTGHAVVELERAGRYRVVTESASISTRTMVLAAPAYETARLLQAVSSRAASAIGSIGHASVASVALAYDDLTFTPPPRTSGVLVSSGVQKAIAGCTWYSTKWPESVADGRQVLRCVVGRSDHHPLLDADDDELTNAVLDDLDRLLGIVGTPGAIHVTRWQRGLPQYQVGHLDRVEFAESAIRLEAPGIAIAGAALRGSGIPDCIKQGQRAADDVIAHLT